MCVKVPMAFAYGLFKGSVSSDSYEKITFVCPIPQFRYRYLLWINSLYNVIQPLIAQLFVLRATIMSII